jgi:hypothetical protein
LNERHARECLDILGRISNTQAHLCTDLQRLLRKYRDFPNQLRVALSQMENSVKLIDENLEELNRINGAS